VTAGETAQLKENEMKLLSDQEYEELLDHQLWCDALFDSGVDNWEGFDAAQETYKANCEARDS